MTPMGFIIGINDITQACHADAVLFTAEASQRSGNSFFTVTKFST
jgi:hypothetical protein